MKEKRLKKFIYALQIIPDDQKKWLEKAKQEGVVAYQKDDFLWSALLQSFATMGSSRGWIGLIGTTKNYERVSYGYLDRLENTERLNHLENVLRDAKVRMPQKKAIWLHQNFNFMRAMGGPGKLKKIAEQYPGADLKILFTKQFYGIGEKYARNMRMDVYHPDFHNTIAIDTRIKKILISLSIQEKSYKETEDKLLSIAHEAGLCGREMDRLLYTYTKYYITKIEE